MKKFQTWCVKQRKAQLWKKRRMRLFVAAMGGFLIAAVLQADMKVAEQVRDTTLRLHILANSDSVQDQTVKLQVRDAVLQEHRALMEQAKTKQEALQLMRQALPQLEKTANEVLQKNGVAYTARARIENIFFATKDYGAFQLPAGRYDALRIELGQRRGKNWFCVMFPPLCVPAAVDADEQPQYSEQGQSLLLSPYRIRFAAIEMLEQLKEWMHYDKRAELNKIAKHLQADQEILD